MSTQTTTPSTAVPTPRRSRRRWYLLAGFGLLLLAAPWIYYLVASSLRERELDEITRAIDEEDPHWRWHDLVAEIKPPSDEKNSAAQILKVHALMQNPTFNPGPKWDTASNEKLDVHNARLPRELADLLRTAIAKVGAARDEARKLKDMPEGAFVIEPVENPFAMSVDHVQKARNIVYMLQLDAYLRAQDRDFDGAAESCQAILNAGGSLKKEPFLIPLLVRLAVQAIAVGTIERTLAQGTVSEAKLAALQADLQAAVAADGLHQAMRGERAVGHQVYLLLNERKATYSEIFGTISPAIPHQVLDAFPGVLLNGYPEYLRLMNEQVKASKLKDVEREKAFARIEQEVKQAASGTRGYALIATIFPATLRVVEACQRSQAQTRCAIAAVAVERYRLKHNNTWPRGLDDVVKAGLLKEVPLDPYDGKPLRFKRTPTGVIVYSVNIDGIDNGGKLDRNNLRAEGTDLGFELWDASLRGLPPRVENEVP